MKNKNIPLLVGIALPIIFIVVISLVIFIPTLSIQPQYNFLYSTSDGYYSYGQTYKNTYTVNNNQITLQPTPAQPTPPGSPTPAAPVYKGDAPPLYLYDVKTNTSHTITFDDTKNYTVDPGPSSPDGYIIKYEYNNNGIFELFGSNNNNSGYFVEKNGGKKNLTGLAGSNPYVDNGNFQFIGWIK